jgi:hypothetical protein
MKKMPLGTKEFGKKPATKNMNEKHMKFLWGAMLRAAWEYIGNDIMSAVQEEGKYDISRDDLIEVVLDADHMHCAARTADEKAALVEFEKLSYKEKIKFAKTVFVAARWS